MAGEAVATYSDGTQLTGQLFFSDQVNFLLSKATCGKLKKKNIYIYIYIYIYMLALPCIGDYWLLES